MGSLLKKKRAFPSLEDVRNVEDLVTETAEFGDEDANSGIDYTEPILLQRVPDALSKLMVEACPLLQERHAVYSAKFFKNVVGLCDFGVEVDDVLKKTPVTDNEVLQTWKRKKNANRLPLANCTNYEQMLLFTDHFERVYGGRPDNKAFSMRYLRACFATFIYKIAVNWAVEAANRRAARVSQTGTTSVKKLMQPIAFREQLQGLVDLIASIAALGGAKWRDVKGPEELTLMTEVKRHREEGNLAAERYNDLVRQLNVEKKMLVALQVEEENASLAWREVIDEVAKLRAESRLIEAFEKNQEVRSRCAKVRELQVQQQILESNVLQLEKHDLMEAKGLKFEANQSLEIASQRLKKIQLQNLVLRPKSVFEVFPEGRSIPSMIHSPMYKFCPCCQNRGFVSRAAIVASCGCEFHPFCVATLLQSGHMTCPRCKSWFDGAWMAQFGMSLTKTMKNEVERMKEILTSPNIPGLPPSLLLDTVMLEDEIDPELDLSTARPNTEQEDFNLPVAPPRTPIDHQARTTKSPVALCSTSSLGSTSCSFKHTILVDSPTLNCVSPLAMKLNFDPTPVPSLSQLGYKAPGAGKDVESPNALHATV